jgi:drug/metabolite transporter (DMT)-like permease
MDFLDKDGGEGSFLRPFLFSLVFGIPAFLLWCITAIKYQAPAALFFSLLVGICCGYGGRVAYEGHRSKEAAIVATILFIVLAVLVTAIGLLLTEVDQLSLGSVIGVIFSGRITEEMNFSIMRQGRGFFTIPVFAMFIAYKIADIDD